MNEQDTLTWLDATIWDGLPISTAAGDFSSGFVDLIGDIVIAGAILDWNTRVVVINEISALRTVAAADAHPVSRGKVLEGIVPTVLHLRGTFAEHLVLDLAVVAIDLWNDQTKAMHVSQR